MANKKKGKKLPRVIRKAWAFFCKGSEFNRLRNLRERIKDISNLLSNDPIVGYSRRGKFQRIHGTYHADDQHPWFYSRYDAQRKALQIRLTAPEGGPIIFGPYDVPYPLLETWTELISDLRTRLKAAMEAAV